MSEEIWYELHLLGHSFLLGIWFLIVYDGFRLFRQIVPHHTLTVGLEDIGYWVYAAVRLFALLYYENDGNLRAYAIAGVFAGMFLYNLTISLFFRKVLKKIRKSIKMKKERKKDEGKEKNKGNV
ncbi:MAG: spore cortex biosynthesis protein YabQ [bacterium]|nr:spore cortex biosynthesis protein YabQ [bacterium]